jgi:hypothetical protein
MSEPTVVVELDKLRAVFDLLLKHIAARGGNEIAIDKDYFWSIPSPELYDVYNKPADLTIGQVTDSWKNLREMLDDESKAVGYGLVWLADVLRAMGDEAVG